MKDDPEEMFANLQRRIREHDPSCPRVQTTGTMRSAVFVGRDGYLPHGKPGRVSKSQGFHDRTHAGYLAWVFFPDGDEHGYHIADADFRYADEKDPHPMSAQGHTPGQVQGILTYHERASIAACRDLKDPERDLAEMRDALIRISNLDDHSAVRVLAVGIAQDVLARIKARAPEGTP